MQFNFFNKRNDYVESDGPVRYLDASGLQRPLDCRAPNWPSWACS